MTRIAILGSTGSIGRSTLKIVEAYPERFSIITLAAGNNIDVAFEDAKRWKPKIISMATAEGAEQLRKKLKVVGLEKIEVLEGTAGTVKVATHPEVDFVVSAIVGAVTSSFSSSILSAGSMFSWNGVKRLVWPSLSVAQMSRVIRVSIVLLGAVATVLALKVQSVQALWFFTSDLVFVLLFPQLLCALFDPNANQIGSMTAFFLSSFLRIGGGEPLLGLPAFLAYPETLPFRTIAAVAGLVALPIVSRATRQWNHPRALRPLSASDV